VRTPKPLPADLSVRAFNTRTAGALGVSAARLRASDLEGTFHGIRTHAGDARSVLALALAYATKMPGDRHFSHFTAAVLLGLRMPEGFVAKSLHVTSIAPARAPEGRGVTGHQVQTTSLVISPAGLRVTDPGQTWCDLAALLSVDDLIVMGDGLVRRINPPATLHQLADAVRSHEGKRGQRKLVEAFSQVRTGTDSARETMLRLLIVRNGFPEPEVNLAIVNEWGAVYAHADLAYPRYRTILEYDGDHHRTDERQFNIDIDRLDELMEDGWRVLRVNKSLMSRRATLLGKVEAALISGGWSRPPRKTSSS
jgi:hypothetical protein